MDTDEETRGIKKLGLAAGTEDIWHERPETTIQNGDSLNCYRYQYFCPLCQQQ